MFLRRLHPASFSAFLVVVLSVMPNANATAQVRFVPHRDEVTDRESSYVEMRSRGGREAAAITIRCDGGFDLDVYVATPEFLNSSGEGVPSLWRFDSKQAEDERLDAATDGTAAFVPFGRKAKLLTSLQEASRATIRLFDYNGTPYTYTFPLAGSRSAIGRLPCLEGFLASREAAAGRAAKGEPWRELPYVETADLTGTVEEIVVLIRSLASSQEWTKLDLESAARFAPDADLSFRLGNSLVAIYVRETGYILRTVFVAGPDRLTLVGVRDAIAREFLDANPDRDRGVP